MDCAGSLYSGPLRHNCEWGGDMEDLPTAWAEARVLPEVSTAVRKGHCNIVGIKGVETL